MDTLLLAFALVFLAELGDKTQLLTLLLAARWRRLLPIALGLALASFSSHLAASLLGAGLGQLVDPKLTRPIAGIAFLACALWMLWPEGEEGREDAPLARGLWQTTLAALSIYLLAELGDKTQFASVLLALERGEVLPVTAGATLAMLAANLPALWLGAWLAERLPRKVLRAIAALLFAAIGSALLIAPA
ncbi:MAG: UPF0016 family membrane protein [Lysobacterales bacterium]|jgi:putative Ca2+/H+ antiporter (TMEM165/GDT1 family)|nr:MAG: UPF0016 family membrane protein [Xanthomonadales bacterium]